MKLTSEQQLAFARDRHLSVTANAGSGKTTVLIDKYIDILLNDQRVGLDPTKILALTFTKVAAGEMYNRTAKALDKFIEAEKDSYKLKSLYAVRERLGISKITTIHSFCSSILREYPIEAGVAPNFTEINEYEASEMKKNALNEVLESLLQDTDPSNPYLDLFDRYELGNATRIIEALFSSPDQFEMALPFYEKSNEEIIKLYEVLEKQFLLDMLVDLSVMAELNAVLPIEKHIGKYRSFINKLDDITKTIGKKDKIDAPEIAVLIELFSEKCGNKKTINYIADGMEYKSEVKKLEEFVDMFDLNDIDKYREVLIADARTFIFITQEYIKEYRRLKEEAAVIDFDDMIFLVRNMLKDEEIARKIRDDFEYILVDEFQDTNNAQYDIIKALVPSLSDDSLPLDTRCFIVGDGKQSIYRFRSADVRVFNRAINDIYNFNNNKLNSGEIERFMMLPEEAGFAPELNKILPSKDSEIAGNLNLTVSFRLLPIPAAFVNYLFLKLEPKVLNQYEIKYEQITCGRQVAELFGSEPSTDEEYVCTDEFGSVSLLVTIKENSSQSNNTLESDSDEEYQTELNEAEMLANHILSIVNENSEVIINKGSEKVRPNYGDIAILARTRTKYQVLAEALLAKGIPYILHSGNGFYSTQEVQDIVEFLNFINNTNDNVAFASILRSSYFGYSSEELLDISLHGERNWSLYQKFIDYTSRSLGNKNKNTRTDEIVKSLLYLVNRIPISQLIRKIIDTGGILAVAVKSPAGNQIISNLDKFVEYARNFENRSFSTMYDFLQEVKHLMSDSKEPEAVVKSNENAVNITTIHGAKGAEWPIVYLYNTNARESYDHEPFISEQTGITFPIGVDSSSNHKIKLPISKVVSNEFRDASTAEEKRLLYVALTRAKDHLIITATLKRNTDGTLSKPSHFFKYLTKVFDELSSLNNGLETTKGIKSTLPILHNSKALNVNVKFPIRVFTSIEHAEKPVHHSDSILREFRIMNSPEGVMHGDVYSPTRLMSLLEDKDAYILKSVLNLTDEDEFDLRYSDEQTDEADNHLYGTTPGSIIHETMENIKSWISPDGTVLHESLHDIIRFKMKMYGAKHEELFDRIIRECKNVAESKFITNRLNKLLISRAELSLNIPLHDDFLTGSVDCLIENLDGEFEVWDWKSNHINQAEDLERWRQHYLLQMKAYFYFLYHLYPNQRNYLCRLLFTNKASAVAEDSDWIVNCSFSPDDVASIRTELAELINQTKFFE